MEIIILLESKKFEQFNIFPVFEKLKYNEDSCIVVDIRDDIKIPTNAIVIYIYETKPRTSFFEIKIAEESLIDNEKINAVFEIKIANLQKRIEEILYLLYNYKKVTLEGIVVKDENNNKIKPLIEIYYFQKLSFNFGDKLYFTRKHKFTGRKMNIDDFFVQCHTDDEILKCLVLEQDLYFLVDENMYVVAYIDSILYLKEITRKDIIENDYHVVDYISSRLIKEAVDKIFAKYYNVHYMRSLKDAFINSQFEENINEKFNIFLSKLQYGKFGIQNSELLKIINALPVFTDHRKKYLDKLIVAYKYVCKNEPLRIISRHDYLTITEQSIIDKNPINSLKNINKV
ncbi:hypothetical protein COBT_001366 [Conglomerata obtusa]